MNKLKILLIAAGFMVSCTGMLDEETVGVPTSDLYTSEAGVEQLVNAAYNTLRYQFNGEQSFTLWNYGVDEYLAASDGQNKFVDAYTNQLNSSFGMFNDMWAAYYGGINRCNMALEMIPNVVGEGGALSTPAGKAGRLAEVRFLRGYFYFMLVQQFGSIPLPLSSTVGVKTEFPKVPVSEVYKVIISDFRAAEAALAATQSQRGRITKGAARHFLAKAYLTRGSAVTEQRGQLVTDMDSAAYFADLVIDEGPYSLMSNYADLWTIQNEYNSEVILSVQFNNNALLLNGSGNRTHLYYIMTYDTKPGMLRDIPNGRPWRRLKPTDYTINVFDRKNDSRFYKSYKTVFFSNNANNIPKWTQTDVNNGYVDASKLNQPKFKVGDTAIFVTVDPAPTDAQIKSKYYSWYPKNKWSDSEFLTLLKFLDPTRLDVATETAGRDGVIARLGETILIAAEAYGRKGDYATAAQYINLLRTRAAYKDGEVKPTHFYKTEGGMYGDVTNTIAAITIPANYWDADQPIEQYPPSATTTASRFIHFMLNERTRELLGEFYRWNDLVRTETLAERVSLFNPRATGNIQEFHKLRPIPQPHLDGITTEGRPLTAEEKAEYQNPGY